MNVIEIISQPWPWYVSGAVIWSVFMLLLFFGKKFGFSSNLRTFCAMCGAGKYSSFFKFDWRSEMWNILFLIGAIIGGFIAYRFLQAPLPPQVSVSTISDLQKLGFAAPREMQPPELFSLHQLSDIKTFLLLIAGGLLIGFGTRWADGCTSGHAISGLSNLQVPSLIAVIGFFIGGLIMSYVLFPLIFW